MINDFLFSLTVSGIIVVSFTDSFLYKLLGVNINDTHVINTILSNSFFKDTGLDIIDIVYYFAILIILAVFIFFINKQLYKLPFLNKKYTSIIFISTIILFSYSYILLNVTKKEVKKITFFNNIFSNINIDDYDIIYDGLNDVDVTINNPKNILIIISESLRSEMLNLEIMPNLSTFIENNNCLTSKNHYSGSHTTVPSIFSIIYGIDSYYTDLFANKFSNKSNYNKEKKSAFITNLKKNGYNTLFYSSSDVYDKYIYDNFDIHQQFNNDADLITAFSKYFFKNNNKKNLYILFLNSSHYDYSFPKSIAKFKPFLNSENISNTSNLMNKSKKEELFNRYKNSVHYIDILVKDVINILQKKGVIADTIFTFTGDHGEEFWEKGFFGHIKPSFNNERISTPFVLCSSELSNNKIKLSSHYDIFPTIFDILKINNIEKISSKSIGISLLKYFKRYFIVASIKFPFDDSKLCLINEDGKIIFNILSGIRKKPEIEILEYTDLNDNILKRKAKTDLFYKHFEDFKINYMKYIELK